jgi:aspartyl-tRNA(Asn)/glutamyl-tRNA(Gln) amidotransferase subunit A
VFTVPASIVGMPAVSVPVGLDSRNLPVGMHLICDFFEEGKLMGIARCMQRQ